ncbi:MAG: phenylalanine--tRNA ligase subunit beta [Solirubrobacteraceae bacterium]
MLVPLEWLRSLCDPSELTTAQIAARLTMSGTKDERVFRHGPPEQPAASAFVVGRVLGVAPHPDADRLRVCEVAADRARQIVCGAPNVAAGQTVAVALPGAVMADGTKLEATELRGVASDGMILAEDEVGVGVDHAGIMVLEQSLEPGAPLHFGTDVIEFEVTPNRPDCLGVFGIARELHASTGAPLAPAPWSEEVGELGELTGASVEVACPELCPRFTARLFEGVAVGPSPLWLKQRLTAAGQRPINNVVDITNYVMLLCGQPLHAFDFERVEGGALRVRRAKPGEIVETLDGVGRELDDEMVLIEDAAGPTSIAGVMGGARSEVSGATTRVLLEAASWVGANIQRTSQALGLRSEASGRFEKGLSPESAMEAQIVATRLLCELCGARVISGTIDVGGPGPPPAVIELRPDRVSALLGAEVSGERCGEILGALGFAACGPRVGVPHFRREDVAREVDLIEEVARIDGLERLPATLPPRRGAAGRLSHAQRVRRRAEDALVGRGLQEIVGWSFASPELPERLRLPGDDPLRDIVAIQNPMSQEASIMRPTLVGSLLDAAAHNAARGRGDVALFESGTVYRASAGEHHALGVLLRGALAPDAWSGPPAPRAEFFLGKALLAAACGPLEVQLAPQAWSFLHPGASAAVLVAGERIGVIGEVHPLVAARWSLDGEPVVFWAIDMAKLAGATPALRHYTEITAYPSVHEDIALVLADEVPAQRVLDCVHTAGGTLLEQARVFDVFHGEQIGSGRKSLALHLEFRAADRTLTDEDVQQARAAILAAASEQLGGELRV